MIAATMTVHTNIPACSAAGAAVFSYFDLTSAQACLHAGTPCAFNKDMFLPGFWNLFCKFSSSAVYLFAAESIIAGLLRRFCSLRGFYGNFLSFTGQLPCK